MATVPSDPRPVVGRVDASGCLISADPRLESLQRDAGSIVGRTLAVPQLAAVAKLAERLGTMVSRPVLAASRDHDLELWVRATPDGQGVDLVIESWIERPASGPRLATLLGSRTAVATESATWAVNGQLEIVGASDAFAEQLGVPADDLIGQPLTRMLRLEADEEGAMPLLAALAARGSFSGQRARAHEKGGTLLLSGESNLGPDGRFGGLTGSALPEGKEAAPERLSFDVILDEALRSPLERIVQQAEYIVDQADGPIRHDYADYGNDIASAARHLLSVIRSMSEEAPGAEEFVDLGDLTEEAVVMLQAAAEERAIAVRLRASRRLPARADRRAVIQIIVNLLGNAIRHSPEGGQVDLDFARAGTTVCVSIQDEGPGIPAGDEERIFEPFERATEEAGGTGLGLAIARRLARSMGGDVELEQRAGKGARFTLCLPAADAG